MTFREDNVKGKTEFGKRRKKAFSQYVLDEKKLSLNIFWISLTFFTVVLFNILTTLHTFEMMSFKST